MNVGALTCSRIDGVFKSRGRAGEPGVVVVNEVALLSELLTRRPTDLLTCTYSLDLGSWSGSYVSVRRTPPRQVRLWLWQTA